MGVSYTRDTLIKILGPDRMPCNGGSGQWPPVGEWTKPISGNLALCAKGYHVCTIAQSLPWLNECLYTVEYEGEVAADHEKSVVRRARLVEQITTWDARTARLFAADCAEHTLYIFLRVRPDDSRPQKAIDAARAFARGEIDDAARDAARAAAWAAARATAEDAAWDAASMATAEDAARDAARAAERAWQITRLLSYLNGERV